MAAGSRELLYKSSPVLCLCARRGDRAREERLALVVRRGDAVEIRRRYLRQ